MQQSYGINPAYIFDLDGVLADSSHRTKTLVNSEGDHVLDLDHWRANSTQEGILQDKPLALADDCRRLSRAFKTLILTSRVCSTPDYDWIFRHTGLTANLVMHRQTDRDMRDCPELKLARMQLWLLQENRVTRYQRSLVHFYDDSLANCLAIQSLGVTAHHVPSSIMIGRRS